MKLVIIILVTLFPFYPNTNNDEIPTVHMESEVSVSKESALSFNPVYNGPFTVNSGSFIDFMVTPSSGCSGSTCEYRWLMRSVSDGLPITSSDEVDRTLSPNLPWIIGIPPSGDDFYFRVEEVNLSTGVSRFTNTNIITVI